MFKNFEVRSNADKTLIFITVFISKCLEVIQKNPNEADAKKNLMALIGDQILGSSDPKFFMSTVTSKSKGQAEEEKFRQYLKQLKEETVLRLVFKLYNPNYGTMDLKFWLAFTKKKFLKFSM